MSKWKKPTLESTLQLERTSNQWWFAGAILCRDSQQIQCRARCKWVNNRGAWAFHQDQWWRSPSQKWLRRRDSNHQWFCKWKYAWDQVNRSLKDYWKNLSDDKQVGYECTKRVLDDACNTVMEQVLKEKIEMVETVISKHGLTEIAIRRWAKLAMVSNVRGSLPTLAQH